MLIWVLCVNQQSLYVCLNSQKSIGRSQTSTEKLGKWSIPKAKYKAKAEYVFSRYVWMLFDRTGHNNEYRLHCSRKNGKALNFVKRLDRNGGKNILKNVVGK